MAAAFGSIGRAAATTTPGFEVGEESGGLSCAVTDDDGTSRWVRAAASEWDKDGDGMIDADAPVGDSDTECTTAQCLVDLNRQGAAEAEENGAGS